jgi:capsular polysaccharide biosynthesis protein
MGTAAQMRSNTEIRRILDSLLAVALAVAVTAAAVFLISSMAEKVYTAESQIVVVAGLGADPSGNGDVLTAPRIAQTYASLGMTRPVLNGVIDEVDLPFDAVELQRTLRISTDPTSPFIVIAASDNDPVRAAATADAMANTLVERATVPPTTETPAVQILEIVEHAVVPVEPSGPRVLFNTMLGAATAFVLGLAAVAVVAYLRRVQPPEGTTIG